MKSEEKVIEDRSTNIKIEYNFNIIEYNSHDNIKCFCNKCGYETLIIIEI